MELEAIANMAAHRNDEKRYLSAAQQNLRDLESLLDNAPIRKAKQITD